MEFQTLNGRKTDRSLRILTLLLSFCLAASGSAKELVTESIQFIDAPSWLTERQLETTVSRVESKLEWKLRRIKAYGYTDARAFEAVHKLGPKVPALFRHSDSAILVGPEVNKDNFDPLFAHECVHAIFFQKYKTAIPDWLNEGLANYIGRMNKVNYPWLATQSWGDVRQLKHPYRDAGGSKLHYAVATALIEMIASKCSLPDLLQLSVGAKLDTYLGTFCEIQDLNQSFREWVSKKAKSMSRKNQNTDPGK